MAGEGHIDLGDEANLMTSDVVKKDSQSQLISQKSEPVTTKILPVTPKLDQTQRIKDKKADFQESLKEGRKQGQNSTKEKLIKEEPEGIE